MQPSDFSNFDRARFFKGKTRREALHALTIEELWHLFQITRSHTDLERAVRDEFQDRALCDPR